MITLQPFRKAGRLLINQLDEPALVLIYHRVIDLNSDPQLMAVSPDNFDAHLNYLKHECNLLNVEEFLNIKKSKETFPKRSVIITFDDGYADNFLNALPILEKYKTQAIFYISTGLLGTKEEQWWDQLERVFLLPGKFPACLSLSIQGKRFDYPTNSAPMREKAYRDLHPIIKLLKPEARDQVIDELLNWRNIPTDGREGFRSLTDQEIKKMSLSKSTVIGAHTINHPPLSILSHKEQYQEIVRSKESLEEIIDKQIIHFSYPFGCKPDYNNDSKNICRELGFEMVCANFHNQVHRWSDPLDLPRVLIRNWDKQEFIKRINNFFRY